MIKKLICSILLIFVVTIPITVLGSSNTVARIGNNFFDDLSDAIAHAGSEDTIVLLANESLENTLLINKTININLNGHNISAPSVVFLVQGGALTVSGKGTIKETEPNYGAIKLIGNNTYTDDKYSLVYIEKDVTLEGWSGIFITHENNKSYGVAAYLKGKINAVSDTNGGTGVGIYVNGNIKDKEGAPVVNLLDGAEIRSNGNGLYIAGYSTWYINNAYIEGNESGIGIKSGKLNINGATIVSNGPDTTPTDGYNNGIKASGTTIQIESNNGYAGNIELNISNGNFTSKNSSVVYEYIGRGSDTQVKSINFSGGKFITKSNKNVFLLSNSFKNTHKNFISGGEYSSNPQGYLKTGYETELNNGVYQVISNAMKEVFAETKSNNTNAIKIFPIIITIILSLITYFNRLKLINFFKEKLLKK